MAIRPKYLKCTWMWNYNEFALINILVQYKDLIFFLNGATRALKKTKPESAAIINTYAIVYKTHHIKHAFHKEVYSTIIIYSFMNIIHLSWEERLRKKRTRGKHSGIWLLSLAVNYFNWAIFQKTNCSIVILFFFNRPVSLDDFKGFI